MSLEVACDLMHPRLLQRIVDVGIANRNFALVQNAGLLMLLLTVVGIFAGSACTVFAIRWLQSTERRNFHRAKIE